MPAIRAVTHSRVATTVGKVAVHEAAGAVQHESFDRGLPGVAKVVTGFELSNSPLDSMLQQIVVPSSGFRLAV